MKTFYICFKKSHFSRNFRERAGAPQPFLPYASVSGRRYAHFVQHFKNMLSHHHEQLDSANNLMFSPVLTRIVRCFCLRDALQRPTTRNFFSLRKHQLYPAC